MGCAAARAEAAAELASALCFWCAHASLAPGPGVPGGVPPSAAAVAAARRDLDPFESALMALRHPVDEERREGITKSAGKNNDGSEPVRLRLSENVPFLPCGVGPRLAQALIDAQPPSDCRKLDSRILDRGLAFLLRGMSSTLWHSNAWELLYADWCDGRSFGSFLRGVRNHKGLAIILVRGLGGSGIIGAVCDWWEEGNGAFGGSSESFLFALWPTLRVFRPTGRGKNYAYLNSRNKKAPRGVGFGGQQGCCRLWIDSNFDECQVLESDSTYALGPLISSPECRAGFTVSHIEVWSVGITEGKRSSTVSRLPF